MPIPERTGIHCSLCNGPILRHREWGASWYECESCGSQRSIARIQQYLANVARPAGLPQASQATARCQPIAAEVPRRGASPVMVRAPQGEVQSRESRAGNGGKARSAGALR
jgi:hypothetical protein